MNLKYQPNLKPGYNKIIDPSTGLKYIKEFSILNLGQESVFKDSSKDTEIGLIVLEGACSVKVGGKSWDNIGKRQNLFEGAPSAVYIPSGFDFEITGSNAKIAICKAPSSAGGEPVYINPDQIESKIAGKDNWAREVRIIIGPESISQRLIIGETINPAGNWSGTPPHKHSNEELYYFYCDKPQGWGIERIYTDDKSIDELFFLKNNTVTIMPKGYHQIVAGPGYNIYYLWILAGENNKLTPLEDPDHNWIKG